LGHPTESPAGHFQFTGPSPATNAVSFFTVRQP
jgi:hypothetical protein